jgi:hypothetical protein
LIGGWEGCDSRVEGGRQAARNEAVSWAARIGFAEMTGHGWLTADRLVQFTDWNSGDRVIVNFGDRPCERPSREPVPPRSFAIEKVE